VVKIIGFCIDTFRSKHACTVVSAGNLRMVEIQPKALQALKYSIQVAYHVCSMFGLVHCYNPENKNNIFVIIKTKDGTLLHLW
jgi:hypothetical protein